MSYGPVKGGAEVRIFNATRNPQYYQDYVPYILHTSVSQEEWDMFMRWFNGGFADYVDEGKAASSRYYRWQVTDPMFSEYNIENKKYCGSAAVYLATAFYYSLDPTVNPKASKLQMVYGLLTNSNSPVTRVLKAKLNSIFAGAGCR